MEVGVHSWSPANLPVDFLKIDKTFVKDIAVEVLRTLCCDVVQGYLLSKPVSAIMATAVLEQAKVDAGQ